MTAYDTLIFGGGIFGSYVALYLKGRGQRVAIIEKEDRLFTKASIVNQARLHNGCHYPRSMATAMQAHENRERFIEDHRPFVNFNFSKYYAIDQYNSLVDAAQFERFCNTIGIPLERTYEIPGICFDRLEAAYKTVEYSFDPYRIGEYYKRRLIEEDIPVYMSSELLGVEHSSTSWFVAIRQKGDGDPQKLSASLVVNATYASINTINKAFGVPLIEIQHEISEIALIDAPLLSTIGFTVMDGPFCSIMPFGQSGLLSLSSVVYTHHEISRDHEPKFACQKQSATCRPHNVDACLTCPHSPPSNLGKMIAQLRQYTVPDLEITPQTPLFTVKTKLKASYIDDSRPTLVRRMRAGPDFICLFGGKINSIYEIEREIEDV
jgi:hypothetical protein